MTGHKGNSEFCFPETLNGKQNSLFPEGPVIKCFVIPPLLKYRKSSEENDSLDATAYTGRTRKIERLPTCLIEKSR